MLKRAVPACVLCLLLVPAVASASSGVQVDKVRVTEPLDGRVALLVGVRYPIEMIGRGLRARVKVQVPGAGTRTFRLHTRGSGGAPRSPDRRRRFTFVHEVLLNKRMSRLVRAGAKPRAAVVGIARLDVDRDGIAESVSRDRRTMRVVPRAGRRFCASLPQLRTRPGKRVSIELPDCGASFRWSSLSRDIPGRVRVRNGRLTYWPPKRYRGTTTIRLFTIRDAGFSASSSGSGFSRTVEIKVGTAQRTVVRAMGDSVTAGFGYYDNGGTMRLSQLLSCKPGEKFYNDACSSNSVSRSNKGMKVEYAADYGLANDVSWAAQWSNEHGITNYKNFAVSGSEPSNWWTKEGQLYKTTKRIESEKPDYILMTMGANPLLSEMLFGIDNMGCAIWSSIFGEYRKCIEEAFAGVNLRGNLKALYADLIENTEATIFLMQYHLSVPSSALAYSATQIAEMGALLNAQIASVAAEVNPKRLRVVSPPHFDVGIDISPVYPSKFSCSRFGFKVDGPSVQSTLTQDELTILHPLSFCSGPPSGPPWVISGDTGIHPSATGYTQMASQVPAPTG